MIFIHLLLGIILGLVLGNTLFFVLGSIFPDLDHIYIIIKNRIFSLNKIIKTIRYEKKYSMRYKTPLTHSILALIIFTFIIYLFNNQGVIYFVIAYFLHLLIDWIDIDEKYYLYPFKIKFKGFLPIWSKAEKIITIILILIIIILLII